jgi:nicotinate (nicotinamide) nucleotide adenylyltransferase
VKFYQRATSKPRTLGILAGSFNPPTIAHFELASAAGFHVDEVVCVVPRAFPHKRYDGATLEQRIDMLGLWELMIPHSIATSDRGLFIDIARECRTHYDTDTRIYLICGRDAAERILTWDYGRPGVVKEMLAEVELLVAPRGGEFQPPPEFKRRIHSLGLHGKHDDVSSSEVRERIARGGSWEHLVPRAIVGLVREIYGQNLPRVAD